MTRFLLLGCLLMAGCARPVPQAGVTELVYASPYSPAHPFSRADKTWMKFVEARSGGNIKVRPIWSGSLLSSDQSMEELRHGIADVGLVTPIYARGGAHLIRVQSGFYSGARTPQSQVALYRCMTRASPEYAKELDGLEVLAVQGGILPGIVTRNRPVRSLADLKGLRLRAPSELISVLRELGADPVNMPMGEVYSALAKGVLDGVIAPPDTFGSLHFAEVAHYFTALEVPRGAYPARVMSSRRWKNLSADAQKVLLEGIPVWEAALASENEQAGKLGLKTARAANVTVIAMPAAEQTRFDTLYLRDAERNARSLSAYGIDGMTAFRAARSGVKPDGSIQCGGA
jgi:TRAP-type C4-dicarboxylate transport system substrate-binding protein